MNNIMTRKNALVSGALAVALAISLFGAQFASAAITASLDVGSTGSNVTELQTYLAQNPNLYPSGLVTGYFGSLTQAGVQKFQTAQGIVSSGSPESTGYGRVGPQTMAKLNAVMGGSVLGASTGEMSPILSNLSVQTGATNATFAFNTNVGTKGHVYYDVAPIRFDEATGPRQLPYVSGSAALDEGGLQTNHVITVQNLQPNTTYYYLVRGVDGVGNMSLIWPSSFRTGQ